MIVLVPQAVSEKGNEWLRAQGYEVRSTPDLEEETICRAAVDCDAMLVRNFKVPRHMMEDAPRLKVIARNGVGVDNIDVEAATELGIWVVNAPVANSVTVAEHTIGLILALAHRMILQDCELRAGNFEVRNRKIGVDAAGKTLGVIGLGNIGLLAAKKAALGLDMKVIAYVRSPREVPDWIELVEDRDDIFRRADFVSVHVPSTPETVGSVGERELGLMKPSAYLINTARGDIVDEKALVAALQESRIAGAGLDTFAQEPPPLDHPLFHLDNVVLTPHSAALTVESMERMAIHAGEGIHQVLQGERPRWPLNEPRSR